MEKARKVNLSLVVVLIGFVVFSVVYNIHEDVKLLSVLPCIVYIILYIGVIKIYKYYEKAIGFCMLLLSTLRYYILPLFVLWDKEYMNSSPIHGYGGANHQYFIYGVLLTLWESVFIGLYINSRISKWYLKDSNTNEVKTNNYDSYSSKSDVVVCFVLVFFIISLMQPQVFNNWHFILLLGSETEVIKSDSTSLMELIASISLWNFFLLLPVPIFCKIITNRKIAENTKYLLSVIVFFICYGLFINGTSRASVIFPLVTAYLILLNVFPNKRKQSNIVFLSLIISVFVLITVWKFYTRIGRIATENSLEDTIGTMDIYFQGFSNMGKAVVAKMNSGVIISPSIFFNDILRNVPILSKLTSRSVSSSQYFLDVWGRNDQVIPAAGNGLFYFGYILSPIVSVFQISVAHNFEKRALNTKMFSSKVINMYICVMLTYGCFSSISIFMQKLSNTVIVVLFVSLLNSKVKLSSRRAGLQ